MNYPSIHIEGAILSPDIIGQVENLRGQKPRDFGLDSSIKVKDEIARSWADARDYWRIFQRKLETVRLGSNATTETRNLWVVPLMGLLRYNVEYQSQGTRLDGRIYAISHLATNRADTPVQIIGTRDPAGLDRKPANASRRMSAHALVQEFLNLHDQLYGLVTNGQVLRLLRDSSRLVKQSYLEFDLDRIFTDGLFPDFAILYRLLHATRLPLDNGSAAESLIELYHQDSLDQGARIREGLCNAVEKAVLNFGNGFLKHAHNQELRTAITSRELLASDYYQQLLRLIYRMLFLMVIEERDLVFPINATKIQRDIHHKFYSIARLRRLSDKRYLAEGRHHDLWLALQACFRLFEADGPGSEIGITPLAGDLFSPDALHSLGGCALGNDVLLKCLRSLNLYRHPDTGNLIRVNYAALNVEEFGSVYEGLLEYKPEFVGEGSELQFRFRQGGERAATGSHYTPDDLVQPLIQHSLDHLIDACLKTDDPETALLNLRVADIACGSGHILLAAARRIANKLAMVRTGEKQPSPFAYRTALRDAICKCIYGVDLNPLAVELCKVALWLEAHNPGEPLNFLDHHIKCGNAIIGFVHYEKLGEGIPTQAFKTVPGDDKSVATAYRKRNKEELKQPGQLSIDSAPEIIERLDAVQKKSKAFSDLPENTLTQIDRKKECFAALTQGENVSFLRSIADIPVAQFYVPIIPGNEANLVTDSQFRGYWRSKLVPQGEGSDNARRLGRQKRFFHWFLEFPEIMERGGFDCILGNPPYLGGKALSGTYGHAFCEYIKWQYAPTGLSDLVVYFLRRIYGLLRDDGFAAIITTNSIVDSNIRRDGLEQIISAGGQINMAVRGMKWPGVAKLVVSLLAVHKGKWDGPRMLDNKPAEMINAFFEDEEPQEEPGTVVEDLQAMYVGSFLRGDGFLLTHEDADELIQRDPTYEDVIRLIINGRELNNEPDQAPGRSTIDFFDKTEEQAMKYPEPYSIVSSLVKPARLALNDMTAINRDHRDRWWQYACVRESLYNKVRKSPWCFVAAATTKYLNFSAMPTDYVFTHAIYVFTTDRWDLFSVVQSTLHEVWSRKYSGSLETRLRYTPTKCFDTFTLPAGLWQMPDDELARIGEHYHTHRKELMRSLWLGLTKIYNLFHTRDLSPDMVAKESKKDIVTSTLGFDALIELRRLHVELDNLVRNAYGWQDLELEHDFHEVETLPENDRVRYTISRAARREVLKRLLAENHARTGIVAKDSKSSLNRSSSTANTVGLPDIFQVES